MIITEPKWKSWIVETTTPLFTPDQCRQVIECGRRQKPQQAQVGMGKPGGGLDTKKRTTTISWLPFDEMKEMYAQVDSFIQKASRNHFGFEDVHVTEQAQFTEYPEGGFYDWHMDSDVNMQHEPPVRKISMTVLLSPVEPSMMVVVIRLSVTLYLPSTHPYHSSNDCATVLVVVSNSARLVRVMVLSIRMFSS